MKVQKSDQSGEITVFLSLLLMIMISFLLNLAVSAWIRMGKGEARSLSEMAMESMFSEYRTELLEEYELFFLDGGYRTGNYAEDTILSHYRTYLEPPTGNGTSPAHAGRALISSGKTVSWGITPSDIRITAIQMATDRQGEAVRYQIGRYMQAHTGVDLLQKLTGQEEVLRRESKSISDHKEQYEREDRHNERELQELEAEREKLGIGSDPTADSQNPLIEIQKAQSLGILSLAVPDGSHISEKHIAAEQVVSHRSRRSGYGTTDWETEHSEILEGALFREYLLEQCSAYDGISEKDSCPASRHALDYELEYLLMGRDSDRKNLEAVVNRILLLREGVNFSYLLTDGARVAEAEGLAAAIAGASGMPPLIEAVKWAILLAWAYGESIVEMRILLNGGKVELAKTAASWHLQLAQLADIRSLGTPSDTGSGMNYREWLRMLLLMGSTETQAMRFCDLLEANLRLEQGNTGFCMDDCIYGMTICDTWNMGRGISYSFSHSYGYR